MQPDQRTEQGHHEEFCSPICCLEDRELPGHLIEGEVEDRLFVMPQEGVDVSLEVLQEGEDTPIV